MSPGLSACVSSYSRWAWSLWDSSLAAAPSRVAQQATDVQRGKGFLEDTWQRGWLRGFAESQGWKGFPETDLVGWPGAKGDESSLSLTAEDRAWVSGLHDEDGRRWKSAVESCQAEEDLVRVLRHHAGCLAGWGESYAGGQEIPFPNLKDEMEGYPLAALLEASEWWSARCLDQDSQALYTWQSPTKGPLIWPFWALALHTANHGSYHLGHLEGLREGKRGDSR